MTSPDPASVPLRVLVAGGGVAGLEAVLALRDLAGERVSVALLTAASDFVYRPLTVREPFALSAAERLSVAEFARDAGVELIAEDFDSLDAQRRVVHTGSGTELAYDAVLLALGGRPHPRFHHGVTLDDARLDEQLHGLLEDVDGGFVKALAFVVPARMAWPLPIYELALMTRERAHAMNVELAVTVVTPEGAPLEIFGDVASAAVAGLLREAGVTAITGARCEVPDSRHVVVNPGDRSFEVDRVIALPELFGPAVRGLRSDEHGFIPIDDHCRVVGVEGVYAAGDATDFALKHGGIAAQQADTAAAAIAALAGAAVELGPLRPVIHGMLLTGGAPLYLSARVSGGRGLGSRASAEPSWSPATKIAARYLAPYLEGRASGG
jgi:sulfide:quinone oxidoreductase